MGSLDVLFLFLRALTWRGALALLDVATHPGYTLPINFIATVRSTKDESWLKGSLGTPPQGALHPYPTGFRKPGRRPWGSSP